LTLVHINKTPPQQPKQLNHYLEQDMNWKSIIAAATGVMVSICLIKWYNRKPPTEFEKWWQHHVETILAKKQEQLNCKEGSYFRITVPFKYREELEEHIIKQAPFYWNVTYCGAWYKQYGPNDLVDYRFDIKNNYESDTIIYEQK
jgi:hypothetical protein